MEQILPFSITNEMAVAIGLLGPYALKRCEPKLERLFSSVQTIALLLYCSISRFECLEA